MVSIIASTPTSSATCALMQKRSATVSSTVVGLPTIMKKGKVTCSMEKNTNTNEKGSSNKGMRASLMAAACAGTMSSPAVALVDDRMSTEGTGLPFGLSNNLLGWILLGVFGLIWSFYIVYTSSLDEDEDSGLSL